MMLPIKIPMLAAIAIDNIGFFLIGRSIFGLNVLFNSSSNSSNWLSIGSICSPISQLLAWMESIMSNNCSLMPVEDFPVWFEIILTRSSIFPLEASIVCLAIEGHLSCIKGIRLSSFSINHLSERFSISGSALFSLVSVSYTHLTLPTKGWV